MQKFGVDEAQAARVVGQWLHSGLLFETRERDPETRKDVSVVKVNAAKRPGERK